MFTHVWKIEERWFGNKDNGNGIICNGIIKLDPATSALCILSNSYKPNQNLYRTVAVLITEAENFVMLH